MGLPLFVVDTMSDYPGLSGLFISGIFSGSLSTVSSAINSLAAVTLEDYIRPCRPHLADSSVNIIMKLLALAFGGVCIALAFLADLLGTGVLFRRVQQSGALTGFLCGLAFVSWIGFGGPKP